MILFALYAWQWAAGAAGIAADQPGAKPPREPAAKSATWDAERAGHLLRRAGFDGTPEQVAFLVSRGRGGAVDYLVDYESIPFDMPEPKIADAPPAPRIREMVKGDAEERKEVLARLRQLQMLATVEVRGWWTQRMITTPRPLEEKMVLFWHGHFTSSIREVKNITAMYRQNDLFRRRAVGNFRDLLIDVSRDPAMLLYLNNAQNRKAHPNENYARELLELFTLGVGHYSERDVTEAARAFTGWTIDPQTGGFHFARRMHDDGVKTFLGRSGRFDGTDIIEIILEQPTAAEHLVGRLWTYFAGTDIPAPLCKRLAKVLRDGKYELKPLLKAMFMSEDFYGDEVMFTRVKGPVEMIVGTLRALEIVPEDYTAFPVYMRIMGQDLLAPPNVKGWDGGMTWINTATLFNRYNLLSGVVYGTPTRPAGAAKRYMEMEAAIEADPELAELMQYMMDPADLMRNQPPYDPQPILDKHNLRTAAQIVDHFVARLLKRAIPADRRAVLIEELKRVGGDLEPGAPQTLDAVRGVIHLILSMPEYQLG